MTIGLQGSWTVSVQSKSASWAQRFTINGSTNSADGTYNETSPPIFVTGPTWGVTVEHNPTGPVSWRQSRHRIANFRVSGGQFLFDIETDDSGGGDEDFNDLILTCAMPLADSEFVVYGQVKSYTGTCLFNPCFPRPYYVVDQAWQLKELLEYPKARKIIEKLYPEEVKAFERIPPIPRPDPPPFRPMMLPSGLAEKQSPNIVVRPLVRPLEKIDKANVKAAPENTDEAPPTELKIEAALPSATSLAHDELLVLGRLHDKFRLRPCDVNPVTETIMRFVEYDRSAAERLNGTYAGEGDGHILGTSATDEFGNYLFRFSQTYEMQAEESGDATVGEDLATAMRPDLIIQLMESLPHGILYATAPYYNIGNVKRINLCVPEAEINPPPVACQGGRAIQALGNLSIITSGTTLHADGTISNSNTTGPLVEHAAWYEVIDLHGCFLDTEPAVTHYVLRYRRDGETDWTFVTEGYKHPKKQWNGTWKNERIGPDTQTLRVEGPGNPMVGTGAYLNIEDQVAHQGWQNWNRDRKLRIHTALYEADAGAVEFRIEGYDASGEKVPGAEDTITLYIDNTWTDGDIDYIKLGTEDPGECALFELSSADQPLSVRYRVTDPEGFMQCYALNVYRGSNTFVATVNPVTGAAVDFSYQNAVPYRFGGTLDETLDPSGYVEITLQPDSGAAWLPTPGVEFCAFSFELRARDRKTNGNGTPGTRILWRELVGISHSAPPSP